MVVELFFHNKLFVLLLLTLLNLIPTVKGMKILAYSCRSWEEKEKSNNNYQLSIH